VAAGDGDGPAGRGAQVGTVFQRGGLDPPVAGLIPEQVAAGGADDRGAVRCPDLQVIQVGVVVDEHGGDGLAGGLAGLDVGGEDFLPLVQLADRDQGAGCGEDPGAGGEGHAAAGGGGPFFCG